MSWIGNFEENMDLSHIYLAAPKAEYRLAQRDLGRFNSALGFGNNPECHHHYSVVHTHTHILGFLLIGWKCSLAKNRKIFPPKPGAWESPRLSLLRAAKERM